MSLRRWLERLAHSFIIVAAVCWWMAYQMYTGRVQGSHGRIAINVVIGALLFGIGLAGVRSRHRHD